MRPDSDGSFGTVAPRSKWSNGQEFVGIRNKYEKGTIEDVRILDCTFDGVAKPDVVEHVTGLVRRNVTVNGSKVAG